MAISNAQGKRCRVTVGRFLSPSKTCPVLVVASYCGATSTTYLRDKIDALQSPDELQP